MSHIKRFKESKNTFCIQYRNTFFCKQYIDCCIGNKSGCFLAYSYFCRMTENKLHTITDANGQLLSPVLSDEIRNFLIDIDGTVCDDVPNEEPWRMETIDVYPDAVVMVNKWFDQGHIITFFTSRTGDLAAITEKWLDEKGFKYHGVLYNKPRGGNYHWIDNHIVRATRFKGKFTELVVEQRDIEVFGK